MLLIRHGSRIASQPGRTDQALKAIPSLWVNFSSSSIVAGRDRVGHELHGATTGPAVFSKNGEEGHGTADLKTEASSAGLGQQVTPNHQDRPKQRKTKPPTRSQPANEKKKRWVRTHRKPDAIEKIFFRCVRLFNLGPDTTLADILGGIAETAPVGRVLHIEWGKLGSTQYRGEDGKIAFVLFDTDAAAADLVRLAKRQIFLVRGQSVNTSIWRDRQSQGNFEKEGESRVIHMRGPQDVEGFSEQGIRSLLMANDQLVQALGPLGLDAEACITKDVTSGRGSRRRTITWRFFSQEGQARPVLMVLRRLFDKSLGVRTGPDPCWDENLYPKGRTANKDARYSPGLEQKEFVWPSVPDAGPTSSDNDPQLSFRKINGGSAGVHEQMPKEDGQTDQKQDIQLVEKLYGSRNTPLRLDKWQEKRIAAWTAISHSPKANVQLDSEIDSPEEAKDTNSSLRSFEQFFNEAVLPDSHKGRPSKS